jgi:hypothetical protein
MGKMYYGSIDVSKIDKQKLFVGKKGTYLNVTIWVNDEVDKFGNVASVIEGQTQQERESKAPKNYLGNLKEHVSGQQQSQQAAPAQQQSQVHQQTDEQDDPLPF